MNRSRPSWLALVVLPALLAPGVVGLCGSEREEVASLARRIERQAADLARAQVVQPDRFEVLSARFGGADRTRRAVLLEPADVVGPNLSGVVRISFRMLDASDGVPRGMARASVRGRVLGPALQATRTLPRGRLIAASDLELRDTDLTRLAGEPLRDPARALGLVPLRTLGPGRVLAAGLLRTAPVVRRGETVELRYQGADFRVVVSVVALRDGAPGERVPAENAASGVVVHGLVRPDGTLSVTR